MITWRCAPFDELTPREIHDMLQARSAAFVVEQSCVFLDIDGIDPACWHLVGYMKSGPGLRRGDEGSDVPGLRRGDEGSDVPGMRRGDEGVDVPGMRAEGAADVLVATARLVPPGVKFAEPSIGRVVTMGAVRGTGLGRVLMREAIAHAERLWPRQAIRVAAQQHLEKFYGSLGFVTTSASYMEDGIPHVDMLRPSSKVADRGGEAVGQ
ncbi:MAG TPA: GNAT family N-acetyltransferase [Usitatibacter sp.]|nr:GNAT family N-acetyltransferase [Usitatibacter sp.]